MPDFKDAKEYVRAETKKQTNLIKQIEETEEEKGEADCLVVRKRLKLAKYRSTVVRLTYQRH